MTDHILNIDLLDLSNNDLTDAGLNGLVQKMASFGSTIKQLNLSGNRISDETLLNISDHIRKGNLKHLATVVAEDCKKVTREGKTAMKVACMKAERNQGNKKLGAMMEAAKQRD